MLFIFYIQPCICSIRQCILLYRGEIMLSIQYIRKMIKKIFQTEEIFGKRYYLVQFDNPIIPPHWVNDEVYPQAKTLFQQIGIQKVNKRSGSSLKKNNKSKKEQYDLSEFLNKRKNVQKRGMRKRQNYAMKLQREGISQYKAFNLQRLQKIIEKLTFQIQKPQSSVILDYQIDSIQAVFKTKANQVCFIVHFIGKHQRFTIPLKKMKKHFPRSLKEYLSQLLNVHKSNQPQIQPVSPNPFNDDSEIYHESSSAPKPKSKRKSSKGYSSPEHFYQEQAQIIQTPKASQKQSSKKQSPKIKQPEQLRKSQLLQQLQKAEQKPIEVAYPKPKFFTEIFSEESDFQ